MTRANTTTFARILRDLLLPALPFSPFAFGTTSMKRSREIFALVRSVVLLLASGAAVHSQSSFTKVTTGAVANDLEQSVGCAWGDYDNDGYVDLFVVNFGASPTNTLYHNHRDGTFTRIFGGAPVNEAGSGHGCAWGDFDNDGYLDLFVSNLLTTNRLYRNNGDGTFQKLSGPLGSDYLGYSVSGAWGDFDADGFLDLFVAVGALADNQVDALYRNLGHGRFTNVAVSAGLTQTLKSTQGTWADVDGDGRLDLFVTHHANEGNFIYHNIGNGTFQVISNGTVLNERMNSVGGAWGDYDNDGDLDLFVVNRGTSQRNSLYRNNGHGTFEKITTGAIVNDIGTYNNCAWADYDNDGYLDLFVVNENLKNRLYHNSGDGTFLSVTQGSLVNDIANSAGCSWGDYDNDGFLDLFVANGTLTARQRNFLYHNDGNSNHWIKVRCVGTLSNRSAIGAILRAKALINGALRWQMRQVTGGNGWMSQDSLDVSFGLGDATNVDLLRIAWPSGIVQEFTNVVANQTLIVEEPSRLQFSFGAGGPVLVGGGRDAFGRFRRYDVEASTDLFRWSVWTNVVVTNAEGVMSLPADMEGEPTRFYRARRSSPE